jgi:hypothetical protein
MRKVDIYVYFVKKICFIFALLKIIITMKDFKIEHTAGIEARRKRLEKKLLRIEKELIQVRKEYIHLLGNIPVGISSARLQRLKQ